MRIAFSVFAFTMTTAAQAATFNFASTSSDWSGQHAFTVDGVTMSVSSAQADEHHKITSGAQIAHWRTYGLGVAGAGDTGKTDGSQQLDSYGASDVVIFDFDQEVSLGMLSFIFADWWDRADIYLGEDLTFWKTLKVDTFMGGMMGESVLSIDATVTRFAIGAAQYESCGYAVGKGQACWTENSAFQLTSITVDPVELAPVPLPVSGFMLLGAMASMAGWRALRRK